jgi:hypothetical protein
LAELSWHGLREVNIAGRRYFEVVGDGDGRSDRMLEFRLAAVISLCDTPLCQDAVLLLMPCRRQV